jgi:DNA-binding response OmpR family regulator
MAAAVLTVTAAIMMRMSQRMRLLSVTESRPPYARRASRASILQWKQDIHWPVPPATMRIACHPARGGHHGLPATDRDYNATGCVSPVVPPPPSKRYPKVTGSSSILIVDDDPRLCRALARYLKQEGYAVRTATSGREMRERLAEERPNLVILDLMLPDEDGFTLARELRATSDLAIVILTGKADTTDKVVGLELGADDYVTKPFSDRELLARVRSVLRRTVVDGRDKPQPAGSVACFAGWRLDLESYELTSPAGERIPLTPHEFELLRAFVQHGGRVLTREAILDLVAGRDWSPDDRSVDVLVAKLRKKLEPDPQGQRLIETVRSVGYKLMTKVQFE